MCRSCLFPTSLFDGFAITPNVKTKSQNRSLTEHADKYKNRTISKNPLRALAKEVSWRETEFRGYPIFCNCILFDKPGEKRYHNNEDTELIFQNYKMVLREMTLNRLFTLHPPGA